MTDRSQCSIRDAIHGPRVFAPAFKDLGTWSAWLAFLAALFASPLSEAGADIWRACTGRQSGLVSRSAAASENAYQGEFRLDAARLSWRRNSARAKRKSIREGQ
jgi:hypothetical protein